MDTYRKTLLLLKDLFQKSDNSHWEQWIDRDIYEWDNSKSTSHHKSAFGGMGSINDLSVGEQGKIGAWQNNMFDLLKSISWTFATKNKIQFPKATVSLIEGTICRDCSYAEISENGVEHFLSTKHLPTIIESILPTDRYVDLINIENLINEAEVVIDRQNVLTALTEFKINFTKTDNWLKTCPTCNSTNTCVYRWDIVNSDDRLVLIRSKNNLTVNFDKVKANWWKRLMGYS